MVPSSSAVWWRAQIRAREEAARVARAAAADLPGARHGLSSPSCAIALAPAASNWIRGSLAAFGAAEFWTLPSDVSFSWILGAAAYTTLPLLAVGVSVVLAPVVVYLALDE